MTTRAKFTVRLALIGSAAACLIATLGVWRDPLCRQIDRLYRRDSAVVARVFDCPLTRSQLERAMCERLWREGKSIESLTPETRKLASAAALDELIDSELLRRKSLNQGIEVSDHEVATRLQRFANRFDSPAAMTEAMQSQGISSESDLRNLLATHLRQEKYLESQIGQFAEPTDEEARHWFDSNQGLLAQPERIEARQIFLAALDHPPQEAREKLTGALAELTAGTKDFAALASELSEDPATNARGGALGWMTRTRLPADFTTPVFAMADHQPALVRTHLGLHLVEVTGRKPAAHRTYDEAKPEILAALRAIKHQRLSTEFRRSLRHSEDAHIAIYRDLLDE